MIPTVCGFGPFPQARCLSDVFGLEKNSCLPPHRDRPVRLVVNSSMIPVRLFGVERASTRLSDLGAASRAQWHAECFPSRVAKKVSLSAHESVNFPPAAAKPSTRKRDRWIQRCGSIHGAAGNGHRKRTRVRVACGDAIRSCGVGILSSHGHFGRSIARRESLPHVVLEPAGEPPCRRRSPPRGSGLPAAALTTPSVRSARLSALADRTAPTTRRRSPTVIRATSCPGISTGMSGGWRRCTHPDSCTRLHGIE